MTNPDPLVTWARLNAEEVQEFIRSTGVSPSVAIEVVTLKNVKMLLEQYRHNMLKGILLSAEELKKDKHNEGDNKY